ncbi:4-hydroxybenzoate polyprenyltransferase, mitochondrial [Contarinia nasturtii]|uniref:4-hydroxybenzoate polyprenyltransferase, mitochondrial n=1 Tax=Contarinia nasturtii TaxID=265458 RepID=UPI0012D47EC2|nr:4-hydroxybenzoate polyprenyltransferase, mitochondrial [Contarinia nasturtii]
MNFLRPINLCNTLKYCHRSNLFSISLPSISLHTDCTNKRIQGIESCAKLKSFDNTLAQRLHNRNQLDIFHRSSSNHQAIINKNGLFNNIKTNIDPYARLIRFDRPIGSWLLFWPCGWSIALSATAGGLPSLNMLALFGCGAFIMRGAGCTINDLWDKDIDAKVERTKNRPLVNNEIKPLDAWVFLSGQLSIGLMVLLQLNWTSIVIGACSLGLVTVYPLMKRITYWPQFVLGMTFNYGALLGWCATQGSIDLAACLPLYVAGVSWTIIYDTIYAHQDKVDDLIVGIKSTALRFGENTKIWLTAFSTAMMSGLLTSGYICDQTWPYYTAVGLVGAHLAQQITSLNINDPSDCARKFISNHQVGLIIFLGIVIGTYLKSKHDNKLTTNIQSTQTLIEITKDKLHIT